MTKRDVVILGAGPYGLSVAAHLRSIKGLDVAVFGSPMSFWDQNMPVGMFLRSNWTATQIADPNRCLTLEKFQEASGKSFSLPVPIDRFVQYGLWYQKQAVPDVDTRKIERIERSNGDFSVALEGGESMKAGRVVIAAGIGSFPRRPAEFAGMPSELVSHTSEHHDFDKFHGKQVVVIGSGQSALESAALLHESGAEVQVIGRAHHINWLQGWTSYTLHHRLGTGLRHLLYAPTDVGPAGISQLMARPDLLRHLPRSLQDRLRKRAVRPAGARWLVERLSGVSIQLGRTIAKVSLAGDRVNVRLGDGSEQTAQHVFLGTGYRVDISKYSFLAPELAQSISSSNGFPKLREGLESSVSGLHFVGAPAVWSFGPLMQFVSGTTYASRSLLRSIGGKSAR
jgi:FAD-dependent urate hydroxylase